MARSSTFQRAFAGGELSPAMGGRADQAKYISGLRTCRNFLVKREGGLDNRPGTRYVGTAKGGGSTSTFLLRFVSAVSGDSVLLEAGPFYLRVYKNGALVNLAGVVAYNGATAYGIGAIVASGGVNYYCIKKTTGNAPPNVTFWYAMPGTILEIPTLFGNAGFNWVQSGNIITLTSPLVPPYELEYVSLTTWIIRAVSTAPAIGPPTGLIITPGGAGALSFSYIVTAAAIDTYEESIGSAITQVNTIVEGTPTAPHVLNWTAPAGGPAAAEYYIYKDPYQNGTFGFIGTATGQTSFKDIGFLPDFANTPPLPRVLFTTTDNFPSVAAYYQQRRFFANTNLNPDAVFGSRTGLPSNFNISSPLQEDDAITFRIAGNQHNPVRQLVGLKTLVVMTDAGEWTVGQAKVPIAPNSIPADQETYVGVSSLRPVIVGNSIIYVQARGSIVRDVQFDLQVEGLAGRDLTVFAAHLFDSFTMVRVDYQQTPNSIVWVVRSDGTLLGLTYLREQDVFGWHRHDTGAAGIFVDVCVVPEPGEDVVYLLVRRTIGGVFVRYIEKLERRQIINFNVDSFFVDAGLTYSGAPATTIAGLDHLNGQVVSVVADGKVIFNGDPLTLVAPDTIATYTVAAGTIPKVLATPASVIHAGLPIQFADVETLDMDVQSSAIAPGIVRDKLKNLGALSVLLATSARTFLAGPDVAHLTKVRLKVFEANAGAAFTGQEELNVVQNFNTYGRVTIRQVDPLPLTILGIMPSVELGG